MTQNLIPKAGGSRKKQVKLLDISGLKVRSSHFLQVSQLSRVQKSQGSWRKKKSWPAFAVQMKQTCWSYISFWQPASWLLATWSSSWTLCCVARLSSCNDANNNALLEHASMMCVTFKGHKNSAICSSQQPIDKRLHTFVRMHPSFASCNFISSSWHSLSCCKSRLKREDFCNGGGCCGRRMGAGIAPLLGCCGRATLG